MKNSDLENAYLQHSKSLFFYALSLTKNDADAQDLVANAFLKAMLVYNSSDESLYAWLCKVIRNMWIDTLRKRKHLIDEGKYMIEWHKDPHDLLEDYIHDDMKKWLYTKIYALPLVEREVILLSINLDLKDEQIANILHITIENVRVIRYRVKNKLKKEADAYLGN